MMTEIIKKDALFMKDVDGAMIVAPSVMETIHDIEVQKRRIDKQYDDYKKALLEGMEEFGIKKAETDDLVITYVEPTERASIDTKKLWAEYKDVAFACEKVSPVKASVRIKTR